MVRTPCCEKMGMKKGPWTPEEDQILISYIQRYGHGNWRALPKQAGLPRCGKSCRLRWINYLRPDIKRGNFTHEEEETIIKLHQLLGNRWSAIAARLPGRTDNEIKNYWHGHLKKRLKQVAYTGSIPDRREIKEARIILHQYHRDEQIIPSLVEPSISSQNCCLESATRKVQAQQHEDEQFSCFSMVETMKNYHGSNIDANGDFWYNLFMDNSNEGLLHGNLGQFG